MTGTITSARIYFWPLILMNAAAATMAVGGDLGRTVLLAFVLCALASFGFLVNDVLDRRIDRENRAGHFEHATRGTIVMAAGTAIVLGAGALAAAWALGSPEWRIAVALAAGLMLYSPLLRRALLLANVATAVFASSPLWAPMVIAPGHRAAGLWWLLAAVLALLTAREILMDVRDRGGDLAGGRRTLATHFGPVVSVRAGIWLTVGGLAPLVAGLALAAPRLPAAALAGAALVTAAFGYLIAVPAARIRPGDSEVAAIQGYVVRSRFAMALVPLLCLALAYAS